MRTKKHGTRTRYGEGCRCDDCTDAERSYQADYRQRKANGGYIAPVGSVVAQLRAAPEPRPDVPGVVEAGVRAELEGLAQTEARPGLAQTAYALARIMDNPKATNQQPAAAAKLTDILDKLRKGADSRKSRLASVREMTKPVSATG